MTPVGQDVTLQFAIPNHCKPFLPPQGDLQLLFPSYEIILKKTLAPSFSVA